jgi:hypothetical protein
LAEGVLHGMNIVTRCGGGLRVADPPDGLWAPFNAAMAR